MPHRVVILSNIRSLHNVGAIFRTADSAGFGKVYLGGYTGCPPDRRIEKVSLGAEHTVEWEHAPDMEALCEKLRGEGYTLVALEKTDTSEDIFICDPVLGDIALIVGNEVEGVEPDILAQCDRVVHIPMYGAKESLNVSVAAGIAFYQVRGWHN